MNLERRIKVPSCRALKHEAERWQCLDWVRTDKNEIRAKVVGYECRWDKQFALDEIREMTFPDFTLEDWNEHIFREYGGPVFGFLISLKPVRNRATIKVFVDYTARRHHSLSAALGWDTIILKLDGI